ncbi:MAG: hypothetical protein ACKO96_10770 [Flammeovirgaceae bacterium]
MMQKKDYFRTKANVLHIDIKDSVLLVLGSMSNIFGTLLDMSKKVGQII